ncbi:hypothetical protein GOODEAATRI_018741, partial [Goodea atripinnis]
LMSSLLTGAWSATLHPSDVAGPEAPLGSAGRCRVMRAWASLLASSYTSFMDLSPNFTIRHPELLVLWASWSMACFILVHLHSFSYLPDLGGVPEEQVFTGRQWVVSLFFPHNAADQIDCIAEEVLQWPPESLALVFSKLDLTVSKNQELVTSTPSLC